MPNYRPLQLSITCPICPYHGTALHQFDRFEYADLPKVRIPDEIGFEKYVKQYYNLGETFSFEWAVDSDPPPEIVIYFGECHTFEFENEDFQCQSTWTLSESIQSGVKHVVCIPLKSHNTLMTSSISWQRYDGNNETVSVSDKRFWFGDGQSVNVTGSASVAGEYLCRACNELGCSSYAFNTRHLLIFGKRVINQLTNHLLTVHLHRGPQRFRPIRIG